MSKTESRKATRRVLRLTDRDALANLAHVDGTAAAAALVGIHPQTYASLTAGLPAHRSTIALVERRLVEIGGQGRASDEEEGT